MSVAKRLKTFKDDHEAKVSLDSLRSDFNITMIDYSPYDLEISTRTAPSHLMFLNLAYFIDQNQFLHSLIFNLGSIGSFPDFYTYVLPVLCHHEGLRSLTFNGNWRDMHIPLANLFFYNKKLHVVRLTNNSTISYDLNSMLLKTILDNENLHELDLSRSTTFTEFPDVCNPYYLKKLNLYGLSFSLKSVSRFVTVNSRISLETLTLSNVTFRDLASSLFLSWSLANSPSLKSLTLHKIQFITESSDTFTDGLAFNTVFIEDLSLVDTNLPAYKVLSALKTNTSLRSLHIAKSHISFLDRSIDYGQFSLQYNTTLKKLRLDKVILSENIIEVFEKNTTLESISLRDCTIHSQNSMSMIQYLAGNPNLRSLDLKETEIEFNPTIALFQNLTCLQKLKLASRRFISEITPLLREAFKNYTQLKKLNLLLSQTEATQGFVEALSSLTCLKSLTLDRFVIRDVDAFSILLSLPLKRLSIGSLFWDVKPTHEQRIRFLNQITENKHLKCFKSSDRIIHLADENPQTDQAFKDFFQKNTTLRYFKGVHVKGPIPEEIVSHFGLYNFTLTNFDDFPYNNLQGHTRRNRLIRQTRKCQKRITLYQLLLPVLRIT